MTRSKQTPVLRHIIRGIGFTVVLLVSSTLIPGCGVGYVVRSAYFQAELLASRTPVESVRQDYNLSSQQISALDRVADVKAYGREIGLSATENYETIAWGWDRTIWNLSACPPLSFQPRVWRFPVIGAMPYLGFFRTQDAKRWRRRLEGQGYEVYVRTAGAYSTLGWFEDPILLPMLEWDDYRLADTVLHELAHATLWIPGSVKFNESFANFVGETAAFRYLENRFGPESTVLTEAHSNFQDLERWRAVLRDLYKELDALYTDDTTSDATKLEHKAAQYATLSQRVDEGGFHHPDRFHRAIEKGPWNNARLVQYRTYNHKRDWFQAVLDQNHGDLLRFIQTIATITHKQSDPFAALENAASGT